MSHWPFVHISIQGLKNQENDEPNEDAYSYLLTTLTSSMKPISIFVVADGASSSKNSFQAANHCVEILMDKIVAAAEAIDLDSEEAWSELLKTCFFETRSQYLEEIAGDNKKDYYSTLLTIVFYENICAAAQIGDGAIIVRKNGFTGLLTNPIIGKQAGMTDFLLSDTFEKHFNTHVVRSNDIDACLIMSDGLSKAVYTAHGGLRKGFVADFFDYLNRDDIDLKRKQRGLERALEAPWIPDITKDDITLIMAYKHR